MKIKIDTVFSRGSFLTLSPRILLCGLIVLSVNGCVGAGIPIPIPIAEGINELGERVEAKRQSKREAKRQKKMTAYEAQRDGFVACSPEIKGVQCSETLKNRGKIKTKHLVLGGWYRNEVEQALENIIPTSEHVPCCFGIGINHMYVTAEERDKPPQFRFRIYKQGWNIGKPIGDRAREDIPLWDLEVRFAEPDPENYQRAISIMIPRFQKAIKL